MKLIFYNYSVLLLTISVLAYDFKLNCNLHDPNENIGYSTPKQTIPLHINAKPDNNNKSIDTNPWLNIDINDIETWYMTGKDECNQALITMKNSFQGNHARYQGKYENGYQLKCRGKKTLYDWSGMIIWPFGPIDKCPTYSNCWFGLLSCGTPKVKQMLDYLKEIIPQEYDNAMNLQHQKKHDKTHSIVDTLPSFTGWSMKALNMLIRVIGSEIVIPEQRYMEIYNRYSNTSEDIIIAQYHLTKSISANENQQTLLEIRLFELYPSLLLDWPKGVLDKYHIENLGSIYLGGSEIRCRPGIGKCPVENNCCGCDKESFVLNTPVKVNVINHSKQCHPNDDITIKNNIQNPLPLCKYKDSSIPGRWIAADRISYSSYKQLQCNTNNHQKLQQNHQWYEASGNPCLIQTSSNLPPEDNNERTWFYAPYTCKYHFYTKIDALKCLSDQNLTHIHIAGDSMTRDFLAALTNFLEIKGIDVNELKKMTNDLKMNHLEFKTENIIISEAYFWEYSLNAMKFTEISPVPDIYITNYAFAHQYAYNPIFESNFLKNDANYWMNIRNNQNIKKPKYLIYQNAKELQGKRNLFWNSNIFRSNSNYLKQQYEKLGFIELDEYILTVGRYPFTYKSNADGWHFHGNVRNMEVMVFFNMICNKWYLDQYK